MAFFIGRFIGGLIAVALLTSIFERLIRNHSAPFPRLLMANGLSLFTATVLGGFGMADGSDPKFTQAFANYVLPQLAWLLVSFLRENGRVARTKEANQVALQPTEAVLHTQPLVGSTADPLVPRLELAPEPPVARPKRFNNFIARYWRGELSLAISYWVIGMLGALLMAVIPAIAVAILTSSTSYNPSFVFGSLLAIWVGTLAGTVWQVVGVWRSANRHIEARVKIGKTSPWAGLAKFAMIVAAARLGLDFANAGLPQFTEVYRVAFLDDPGTPAYSIRIMRNGTEAEITGGFKYGLTSDFERIVRASPQVRVVHLNSDGGRIGEAAKLNKLIRERGMSTYVSARCLSACTLAFAAGRERWLHERAQLGFHAGTFPGMTKAELDDISREQRDLLTAAGIDRAFIHRGLVTPNTEMWKPTSNELLKAKVITSLSNGTQFAISGYGASVTRDLIAKSLERYLQVLETLRERFPRTYNDIVDGFHDAYIAGKTEAEVIAGARSKLLPLLEENRPLADDAVLVELGKILVEQYAALGAKDPTLCYEYATGASGSRNFSSELPTALVSRESALTARVLQTATKRPEVPDQVAQRLWQKVDTALAKKLTPNKIALIQSSRLAPTQYGEYCSAITAFFQEITDLPSGEAGILIRQILSSK